MWACHQTRPKPQHAAGTWYTPRMQMTSFEMSTSTACATTYGTCDGNTLLSTRSGVHQLPKTNPPHTPSQSPRETGAFHPQTRRTGPEGPCFTGNGPWRRVQTTGQVSGKSGPQDFPGPSDFKRQDASGMSVFARAAHSTRLPEKDTPLEATESQRRHTRRAGYLGATEVAEVG